MNKWAEAEGGVDSICGAGIRQQLRVWERDRWMISTTKYRFQVEEVYASLTRVSKRVSKSRSYYELPAGQDQWQA